MNYDRVSINSQTSKKRGPSKIRRQITPFKQKDTKVNWPTNKSDYPTFWEVLKTKECNIKNQTFQGNPRKR